MAGDNNDNFFVWMGSRQYSKVNFMQYYLQDMFQAAAPICRYVSLFVKRGQTAIHLWVCVLQFSFEKLQKH